MTIDLLDVYAAVAVGVAAASTWQLPLRSTLGKLLLAALGGAIWPVYFAAMAYYASRLPRLPDLCRWCYLCSAKLAPCQASGATRGVECGSCRERSGRFPRA